MQKLTTDDLYSLERYAMERAEFRARVLTHKKNRRVMLGTNAALYFEDRLTIQYQIQEMLRTERIFEVQGIMEELEAYNPLIPDGHNWKATFMLEYGDETERHAALAQLIGIEDRVWVQVGDLSRVYAIADEDMARSNAQKTSAVHFVRFELTPEMVARVKADAALGAGIDHPQYHCQLKHVPDTVRDALAQDID
ncbi:MAG: DUF3501 family protein [Gammaproteobacteria bacterium]